MENNNIFANIKYQNGFGGVFLSQAKEGAVPRDQNSPVKVKYGLFAEQLSGTSFVVKRSQNQKTWLYKLRPSVIEGQYKKSDFPFKIIADYNTSPNVLANPNQMRWNPIPSVEQGLKKNFIQGLTALLGAGEPTLKQGVAFYAYSTNKSMDNTAFTNSDGDFMIVPHCGTLFIKTLNGLLTVKQKEFCVIPRGVKFSIDVEGQAKGWVAQIFGHHFQLPQLGPIGANGLANPWHFQYPEAWFEDKKQDWTILNKYIGQIFQCKSQYSPFDVVGWRGNYSAYKYDMTLFNTIGSVSFDHPDPSIFTVMTVKSHMEGTASLDFVIFPPRWLSMDHTFKPPYYHRNCMTEFMGNICGDYDAKGRAFGPGCSSLHSTMTPHGPDAESYEKGVNAQEKPYKIADSNLSFMFETGYMLKHTTYAMKGFAEIQKDYPNSWQKLKQIKYEP